MLTILNLLFRTVVAVSGASGSPLLNDAGRVIGVLVATRIDDFSCTGAVPADIVLRVATQIVENGKAVKPSIGATFLDFSTQLMNEEYYGALYGGAVLVDIAKNSPAESAGLKGTNNKENEIHHIIFAVNGKDVHSEGQFQAVLFTHKPGDVLQLTVWDGQQQNEEDAETVVEVEVCDHDDMEYPRNERMDAATS